MKWIDINIFKLVYEISIKYPILKFNYAKQMKITTIMVRGIKEKIW